MRAALILCAITAACESRPPEPEGTPPSSAGVAAPPTRRLQLPEVAVDAPADFVDLEPDRVERLRQAAVRYDSTGVATVVGLRAPATMLDGTIYIQSGHARRGTSLKEITVKQALELESQVMREMMSVPGAAVLDFTAAPKDDALETCSTMRMGQGDKAALLRLCAVVYVRPDGRLGASSVACMGDPARADALCKPVMESRRFTLDPGRRKLDEVLPRNDKPLGFVSGSDVAGVVFGSSLADFRAACRKAGHVIDRYDWKNEIPQVNAWVRGGLMSKCSGLPRPGTGPTAFDLGNVVELNVIFAGGKIGSASFFLDTPMEVVEARLAEAHPDGITELGRNVHLIGTPKDDDNLASVSVGPTQVPGAKSVVTFLSKRGMDGPPLPGMPKLPGVP